MSFYQQNTIALYRWFLLVLSCNIFLMTFHGSIFLNIKLGPTTTSSPRRRGRGLHNLDSSHDQIRFFWLAEVRNFTNIMIEYLTLTLDFQGQILKMLYRKNWRTGWHGTKGMWIDRMSDLHCDFELWPHPWPWPLIFKVRFLKSHNSGMGCPIDMKWKGCELIGC